MPCSRALVAAFTVSSVPKTHLCDVDQAAGGGTVSGWQALAAQVLEEVSHDAEPSDAALSPPVSASNDLDKTAKTRPG